jgi:hypothetical protein
MMTEKYIAPSVEIIEVAVEKGFATSLGVGQDLDDVIVDI